MNAAGNLANATPGELMLLPIHVAAGGLAMVLGAVALLVKKGGTIHRRSGLLFVCAMLVMGTTASILGFRKSPTDGECVRRLHDGLLCRHGADDRPPRVAMDPRLQCGGAGGRGRTRARRHRGGVKAFNSPGGFRNGVPFRDVLLPRHRHDPGGGWRRAHHAIRHASRRAAPGAPSVADVLRAVHRGRIVLLDP